MKKTTPQKLMDLNFKLLCIRTDEPDKKAKRKLLQIAKLVIATASYLRDKGI
jgi:hypothetical protein